MYDLMMDDLFVLLAVSYQQSAVSKFLTDYTDFHGWFRTEHHSQLEARSSQLL